MSFFIDLARKGHDVTVNVIGINDLVFPFTFTADSDWSAMLLRADITDRLCNALRAARREAYEQGWKDAKAKKTKTDWFSGWLKK